LLPDLHQPHITTPRNRTKISGSKVTPRAKACVPGAGRAVKRNVADFVRVGMKSVQVTYDFLGLRDLWAASTFLWFAFDAYVPTEVDGYLCSVVAQRYELYLILEGKTNIYKSELIPMVRLAS
jgi:hypothetical protein